MALKNVEEREDWDKSHRIFENAIEAQSCPTEAAIEYISRFCRNLLSMQTCKSTAPDAFTFKMRGSHDNRSRECQCEDCPRLRESVVTEELVSSPEGCLTLDRKELLDSELVFIGFMGGKNELEGVVLAPNSP